MTMTTEPVEVKQSICESDLEKIYDIPGSILYRAEVTLPDGTVKVIEPVRAYSDSVCVNEAGHVSLNIVAKSDRIYSGLIPYPYHYLHDDEWLCALKIHKMNMLSDDDMLTFALNYNLFCLPWKLVVLIHDAGDGLQVFMASREEWERGEVSAQNREVQMFLRISKERPVPVSLFKSGVAEGVASWIDRATASYIRKQ
jgi:hypothetical protein